MGISSVEGTGDYLYGENVTIDANVNNDYNFTMWRSNTSNFNSIWQKYSSFTMPAFNLSLTAVCEIKTYEIAVFSNNNGEVRSSISSSGDIINVTVGESVTLSFIPNIGYYVSKILVDRQTLSDADLASAIQNGLSFNSVHSGHSVVVEFSQITFIISVSAGSHISATPTGEVECNYGSNLKIDFTLDEDYKIERLSVDENEVEFNLTSFTFSNITSNHTLSVEAVLITYEVHISSLSEERGSIVFNNSTTGIDKGESRSFTVEPEFGYEVESVYINGVLASGVNNVYEITNITDDVDIVVNYKEANSASLQANSPNDLMTTNEDKSTSVWVLAISFGLNIVLFLTIIIIVSRRRRLN